MVNCKHCAVNENTIFGAARNNIITIVFGETGDPQNTWKFCNYWCFKSYWR